MRSLNDFLELMNHEFGEIGIELTVYGIKIDGIEDGLKQHCRLNNLKSVDYIYPKNSKFPLVEFSDICRQQHNILGDIDDIKKCNLQQKLRTDLIKGKHKIVCQELAGKLKDTLTIINKLHNHVSDIPENLQNKSHPYYIVYAPFHIEIDGNRKQDLSRFLDDLASKITSAIPDEMFEIVKIISIETFSKKFQDA